MQSSTSTLDLFVLSSDSASGETIPIHKALSPRLKTRVRKNVENAIYSHIQAIRALGRTDINTTEIADALSLPVYIVNEAISSLERKGVKVVNG